MGGSAFKAVLHPAAFPRIPPPVYRALKARLLPKLEQLYSLIAVPAEAPEKPDHGDLDILVACPIDTLGDGAINVPHESISRALGASHMIAMDGNRTSNFAVPVIKGEWAEFGHGEYENEQRCFLEDGQIFYQVDVRVCTNQAEFQRILFFHGYGDLGMIMGLVVRNAFPSLKLGEKGLHLLINGQPPLKLSDNFDHISSFLGFSMDAWKAGFQSKYEIFEWVAGMRNFDPASFRAEGLAISKVKPERKMYFEFVQWVKDNGKKAAKEKSENLEERIRLTQEESLRYFKKSDEYTAIFQKLSDRQRLKQVFSGSRVSEWTGLGNYWVGVKLIMDRVREQVGGDAGVVELVSEEGEEKLKEIVLKAKHELGLLAAGEFALKQEELIKSIETMSVDPIRKVDEGTLTTSP